MGVKSETFSIFNWAQASVASITRKTLSSECHSFSNETIRSHWGNKLMSLSVQGKLDQICQLEAQNKVWNRIIDGLPAGQLSFLLRAGSDTLPTPLHLRRWILCVDAKCNLCGDISPTVLHTLNGCPCSPQSIMVHLETHTTVYLRSSMHLQDHNCQTMSTFTLTSLV